MSARAPFFPMGDSALAVSSTLQSQPDLSNPLHARSESRPEIKKQVEDQPLNIGSLRKKSSMPAVPQASSAQTTRRLPGEGIVRPMTTDPMTKTPGSRRAQPPTILAPSPFHHPRSQSRNDTVFSAGFKTPLLPQNAFPLQPTRQVHNMPPNPLLSEPSNSQDTEDVSLDPYGRETDTSVASFNVSAPLPPEQAVLQHIAIDLENDGENDSSHGHKRQLTEFDDEGYALPAKRYRGPQQYTRDYPVNADYMPPHGSSPPLQQARYTRSPSVDVHASKQTRAHTSPMPPPQSAVPSPVHRQTPKARAAPPALDKLLSCDSDSFIAENTEKYEQLANRWASCSYEEWKAGGEEIAAKFAKILDFTKAHMASKLQLFTSFDRKISHHNNLLEARSETLSEAQRRLVVDSGHVLGTGV
ncbi:hypothetical protein FISHEDRAFT_77743 [Fistulina hepatica ATCC 64428]|nr:hypothetical protein FISHEDRAFT_77743 [Fistulina hepatica ATCC 64428]